MRWLFLLMLLLNIGYVGWEFSQARARTAPVVATANGKVPPIVLLSELESASAAAVNAETAPADSSEPETTAQPALVATELESKTESKTESQIEQKLEPEPAKAAVTAQPASACYTLGPFRELADLRKLIRDIRDFVADASFRSHEEREQSMYWVHLPPQANHEAALTLAEQLKAKKIRDYYVLNSGEQMNAISLGHFRDKNGALSVLAKVRQAGFAPVMEPVFKNYTIYWLDYRVADGKEIPQSVLDLSRLPNVSRLNRDCG